MKVKNKSDYRKRRHLRLRNKVQGTAERPRMAVYVSNRYIYVQVIDDDAQKTLCAVSSLGGKCTVDTAKTLGAKAAEAAKAQGVSKVVSTAADLLSVRACVRWPTVPAQPVFGSSFM